MSDFEKREINLLNFTNIDFVNIDWAFFAIFSKILENVNGGVSYGR